MDTSYHFATPIYSDFLPNFLNSVKDISNEYLKKGKVDHVFSFIQSENFNNDNRLKDFYGYVLKTCHDLLDEQGFDLSYKKLHFSEFWAQEFHFTANQDIHTHPGNLLCMFYFLEVPDNCSKIAFSDPRPSREFCEVLPQKDDYKYTMSSRNVNFTPAEGQIIVAPAWLPHSFTRNGSNKPFKFIHGNINYHISQNNYKPAIVV